MQICIGVQQTWAGYLYIQVKRDIKSLIWKDNLIGELFCSFSYPYISFKRMMRFINDDNDDSQ